MMLGHDPQAVKGRRVDRGVVRRAWSFAQPYRWSIVGFLATIVAAALLDLLPPLVFRRIIDDKTIDATAGTVEPMRELEACTDPKPLDARTTIYPGVGHDSWDRTYDLSAGHDVFAWLLSHEHP